MQSVTALIRKQKFIDTKYLPEDRALYYFSITSPSLSGKMRVNTSAGSRGELFWLEPGRHRWTTRGSPWSCLAEQAHWVI